MPSDPWILLWTGLLLPALVVGAVAGIALARAVAGDRAAETRHWGRVLVAAGAVAFAASTALAVQLARLQV